MALLLAERGRPVRKASAAELLWPDSDPAHGMDNLYKVCGALRRMSEPKLPLQIGRDTLWLDVSRIDSDIARFERLYLHRSELTCCQTAIELYTAPFLINECYEWSARAEAYFDMRYMELLMLAEQGSRQSGNLFAVRYYQRLMEEFS